MRYATVSSSGFGWLVLVALVLMPLGLGGCHTSRDRQLIHSTRAHPADVTVVDTVDDRTLWRMEVPVDHELELAFTRTGAAQGWMRYSELSATAMSWRVSQTDLGPRRPELIVDGLIPSGRLSLTGNPVRIQVNYRDELVASGERFYRYDQTQ